MSYGHGNLIAAANIRQRGYYHACEKLKEMVRKAREERIEQLLPVAGDDVFAAVEALPDRSLLDKLPAGIRKGFEDAIVKLEIAYHADALGKEL